MRRLLVPFVLVTLVGACSGDDTSDSENGADAQRAGSGDCVVVDMAVSPEKIELLTDLAGTFNQSDRADVDGQCVVIEPQSKSSGPGPRCWSTGWDEATDGPRPVIWSPASTGWGAIVDQRLTEQGEDPIAGEGTPFMLTPAGHRHAPADGRGARLAGRADRAGPTSSSWPRASRAGPSYGHPEWGPFRLGKTNPNFSTSGLTALIAQSYAATGKTDGPDRRGPRTTRRPSSSPRGVESAVVHYGDTTLTFLNNLYRADRRGTSLTYASAVAVEEKSVIDYNTGNPDGVLDPGEEPRPPRMPLVAIYPEGGHALLRQPVLRARRRVGVTTPERDGAAALRGFVQEPANQRTVLEYGFRPGNPDVRGGDPRSTPDNGVDPDQPQTALRVPEPAVMIELLERWEEQRKPARVRAGHRRLRLDGRPRRRGSGADEAGPGRRGRASTPSTSSVPTTWWG